MEIKTLIFCFGVIFLLTSCSKNEVSPMKSRVGPVENQVNVEKSTSKNSVSSRISKIKGIKSDLIEVVDGILYINDNGKKYVLISDGISYKLLKKGKNYLKILVFDLNQKEEVRIYKKINNRFKLQKKDNSNKL